MKQTVGSFLRNEQAQDLIEYTLLLAFVCLAAAALFISIGNHPSELLGGASVPTAKKGRAK